MAGSEKIPGQHTHIHFLGVKMAVKFPKIGTQENTGRRSQTAFTELKRYAEVNRTC